MSSLAAITGVYLGSFVTMHLFENFMLHFGLEHHRAWLHSFQPIYKSSLYEVGLLGSFVVHNYLALSKKLDERAKKKSLAKTFFWDDPAKLAHQLSGWFLFMAVPGHAFATRVMTSISGLTNVDITYIYYAGTILPIPFIPYNAMLATAGGIHLITGIGRSLRLLLPGLKALHTPIRGPAFWATVALVTLSGISTALAAAGFYFAIEIEPTALKAIIDCYRKYWPAFLLPSA